MEQHNHSQPWQDGQRVAPQAEVLRFPTGRKELWFAAVMLLCGFALSNFVLFGGFNLGFAVAVFACICASTGYLLASGRKLGAYPAALLLLSLVIAAGFARSDDGFVKFIMVCFLFLAVNLGLCLLAGQNRRAASGVRSLLDAPGTFFMLGLGALPRALRGLHGRAKNSSKGGKTVSAVLLGLAVAVPLLVVMVLLLTSADAAFAGLMAKIPKPDFPQILLTAVWGCGAACVMYAEGTGLVHAKRSPATAAKRKGIAKLTVNTVLIAVCCVYGLYLVSQLAYFVGGFAGILPEGFTMAEYARRGFFEMSWLCAINLGIIALAVGLVEKGEKTPLFTRILCLFIGIVTLFFVVTASAKMGMYIGTFGLTRLRVLTEVIMVFLGLATAAVCVWLFVPKLPYMKVMLLLALVMGAAVIWADVDTVVASYNVHAYQSGRLDTVDVEYLTTLSAGAVPYIAELAEEGNREAVEFMEGIGILHYRGALYDDLRSWNWTIWIAEEIFELWG